MINVVELRPENKSLATNQGFMQINSLEAAMACAEIISQSSFCPKGMAGKSGDIVVGKAGLLLAGDNQFRIRHFAIL